MFDTSMKRRALAAVTAGAMVVSAVVPAATAPVMTSTATLRAAAPDQTINVRWRRGGAWVGGIAAGLAVGAIAAAAARPRYYYEPGYGYAEPYYAPPTVYYAPPPAYYAPAPTYYAPAPTYYAPRNYGPGPIRQCWVSSDNDRGYGYWRPC
jgi:hypothetical protein